jgi:pimeloyl-ACP methyl ester carboxylesterase
MRTRVIAAVLMLGFTCGLHAAPKGIREQGFVRIGGIEQWITIHGADRDNPVVLFLHGGPGNAMSAYSDALLQGWEKDFTLVQWDQRGAGRTFGRSGPSIAPSLTIDRMARDGVEVAEYLARRLHQRRVIVVGSSWGSLLGIHIIKRSPDLFEAYVGTGQLVDMRMNFRRSYERVLEHARATDDASAVSELEAAGPPPFGSVANWRIFRKWRNEYQRRLATAEPLNLVRSPEYSTAQDLADEESADDLSFAHFNFAGPSMTGPLMDVDLRKLGATFPIPVYVIQGAADLNAVPDVAREYVEWIKAPAKQFLLVPGGGHADTRASLEVLRGVLENLKRTAAGHTPSGSRRGTRKPAV